MLYFIKKSFVKIVNAILYFLLLFRVFGITHRFFLLNSPFQKDLLEITEWNGKEYIIVDVKKGNIELMEIEVNRKEKSVKLFRNTLIKEDIKSLTIEVFETKKVELVK